MVASTSSAVTRHDRGRPSGPRPGMAAGGPDPRQVSGVAATQSVSPATAAAGSANTSPGVCIHGPRSGRRQAPSEPAQPGRATPHRHRRTTLSSEQPPRDRSFEKMPPRWMPKSQETSSSIAGQAIIHCRTGTVASRYRIDPRRRKPDDQCSRCLHRPRSRCSSMATTLPQLCG